MRQIGGSISDALDLLGLCVEQRVHLVDKRRNLHRNIGGKARFLAASHRVDLRLQLVEWLKPQANLHPGTGNKQSSQEQQPRNHIRGKSRSQFVHVGAIHRDCQPDRAFGFAIR